MRRSWGTLAVLLATSPAVAQQAAIAVADALISARAPARDDPDATALHLLRVAREHARSAAAALLVDTARRGIDRVARYQDLDAALAELLAADAHGLVHNAAQRMRHGLAGRRGTPLPGDPFPHCAQQLLVIGPFGDFGDHYNGVPFPPELGFPGRSDVLPGRYGMVQPRVAVRELYRRSIDLADPATGRGGCYYALHRVRATAATPGFVELECRGSYQLFLDGAELARVDIAEPGPAVRYHPVVLRPGVRQVLVKTTRNDRHQIALRYVDAAGHPLAIEEVAAETDLAQTGSPGADVLPAPAPFRDGFTTLAMAASGLRGDERATVRTAAAIVALRGGYRNEGLALLAALKEAPPTQPTARLALASAWRTAEPLPEELRRAEEEELVADLDDALVDHSAATLRAARRLADRDQQQDAVRLLQAEVDAGRAGPATFGALHSLLRRLRFAAEERALLEAWLQACPGDVRPSLFLAETRDRGGDRRGALDVLTAALKRCNAESLAVRALPLALDLGAAELADELVARINPPWSYRGEKPLRLLQSEATVHRRLSRSAAARAAYRAVAAHADSPAVVVRRCGEWLLDLGDEEGAVVAYRRSLALAPDQHDLARLLTRLSGAPSRRRDFARFHRDGDRLITDFRPAQRDEQSSTTLVFDQMIVEVFADGSSIEETHQLRRLNDLRGVERYQGAEAAAEATELLLLRTVATDGESYLPRRVAGGFSMPRLEPGAFIEWRFLNELHSPAPDPLRAAEFHFQSTEEPFLLSELVLIVPRGIDGDVRTRNFPDRPEVVELADDRRALVFRKTDMPRLPPTRLAPPEAELVPVVAFGADGEPAAIAREAWATMRRNIRLTPQLADAAADIVAGAQGEADKVSRIHSFVQAEIGDGPASDPTTTLLRRQGERFHLELALLRAIGVTTRLAVVAQFRAELSDLPRPLFRDGAEYDLHAARIEPSDGAAQWLFIDTPRHYPLGIVPEIRAGAPALLLSDGSFESTRLPATGGQQGFQVESNVHLDPNGDASADVEITMRGIVGFHYAEQIRDLETDIRGSAARQLAARLFPDWRVDQAQVRNLEPPGRPLTIAASLSRRALVQGRGRSALLPMPMPPGSFQRTFGDRPGRRLPLLLTSELAADWDVTVDPGPGFAFAAIPAPVLVQWGPLDYALTWAQDGNALRIRRRALVRAGRVEAGDFEQWLRVLQQADRADEQTLELHRRE